MTDRPIIFSGPMVRALIDGRKTQTRRVLCQFDPDRDPPSAGPFIAGHKVATWTDREGTPWRYPGAKGAVTGDRLYVREAHKLIDRHCDYRADWPESTQHLFRWRPSIHMPRCASRITLTVTDVRVQRLQEISETGAIAEGVEYLGEGGPNRYSRQLSEKEISGGGWFNAPTAREVFSSLWNSLHGPDAWDANPWVVAVSFTVDRQNIDGLTPP